MKASLTQLIEELETEIAESSVETDASGTATIYTENDEDEEGTTLNAAQCRLVFHSKTTIRQLFDALGEPAEGTIVLHDVALDDSVKELLERTFMAVDEG